jgi:hypothetical protein
MTIGQGATCPRQCQICRSVRGARSGISVPQDLVLIWATGAGRGCYSIEARGGVRGGFGEVDELGGPVGRPNGAEPEDEEVFAAPGYPEPLGRGWEFSYGRRDSNPVTNVLERSIPALEMNGEPLPAIHP